MLKRKKFLIGGIIITLAILSLSFVAIRGAAVYYYTVSEVIEQANTLRGRNIRMAGQVMADSLEPPGTNRTIRFVLLDPKNTLNRMPVTYQGAIPDAFKEGNDAVVEGRLASNNVFEARQIIVKCPSKYVPKK